MYTNSGSSVERGKQVELCVAYEEHQIHLKSCLMSFLLEGLIIGFSVWLIGAHNMKK